MRAKFPALLLAGTGAIQAIAGQAEPASDARAAAAAAQSPDVRIAALEEQSYAAWQAGNEAFLSDLVSRRFVGWGQSGRIDARAALPALAGSGCTVGKFRLVGKQVSRLTPQVVLITHRTEVEGQCQGKPLPPAAYTASIWVREGDAWKLGYRARSVVADPTKLAMPARSSVWSSGPTAPDPATRTLLARETEVVNAWKDRDGTRMAALFGPEIQFIDIFGNHIGSRARALQAWSGEGCAVTRFRFDGASATPLAPDFGVLTYRAEYDGECFGQTLWPIWGTAFYVRHGDRWLWSSGINVLAGAAAD